MKSTRRLKRAFFYILYAIFLLLLAEVSARAFWKTRGVPFFTAHRSIQWSFYPALLQLERNPSGDEEDCLDVLMLGGSVLNTDYGDIEHVLRERLARATRACVRIYNLSAPAHTSLDSYYKYLHLTDRRFDLFIVYHGINEVRANNCPQAVFQQDYSHLSWYRLINDFERRYDARWVAFPYTIKFVARKALDRLGLSGTLPTHRPDTDSLRDGCHVKTVDSFRTNLQGILTLAAAKQESVILMSFAYYLPNDYNEEAFGRLALDYTAHSFPAELWGKPDCVAAGIDAHNAVIAKLAGQYGQVGFVDQEALMPDTGLYFNDLCHLTHEGSERFVTNMLDEVTGRVR